MAIKITSTEGATKYKKILVYGKSGVGKTRMCRTANNPLIISSEKKFESLSGEDIDVWTVENLDDFREAVKASMSKKGKKYDLVCIDSISDIAETAISKEKPNHNDPRKAYGIVQDEILSILKDDIRDSDKKHFYIIAKAHMTQNEDNMDQYHPKMPGKQMGPELPYIFDYVFAMKMQGEEDGDSFSYLQTSLEHDIKWTCKDSSGRLKPMEEPNLKKLLKKLTK